MRMLTRLAGLFKPGIVRDEARGASVQHAVGTRAAARYPRPAGAVSAGQVRDLDTGTEIPAAWLRPQEIVLDVDARSAAGVLEAAAAYLGRTHALDPALILRALSRREQVGSTGLGMGIAIPHARIEGIARPLTLFLCTRDPVEFGAPDGKPVSRFFVIMVPADGATDAHLQLLALVAQAFSDRGFREHLSAATTAAQVDDVFAQWTKHAA